VKKLQIILFISTFIIGISIYANPYIASTKDTLARNKHGVPIVDFDGTPYKLKPKATICFFDDSHGLADDGTTVTWNIGLIYWWAKKNTSYNIAAIWVYDRKLFLEKHYKGVYNFNKRIELPFMNTEGQPDVDPKKSILNCYRNYSPTSDFYIFGTIVNAGLSIAHPSQLKGDGENNSAIEINIHDQEKYRIK